MNDLGLSAFSGKHVAQGDLGDFLALCENEGVPSRVRSPGRLPASREPRPLEPRADPQGTRSTARHSREWREGCHPSAMARPTTPKSLDNVGEVMMAICTMARAHEESAIKSDRNCSAWKKQRKEIRAGEKTISKVLLPTWIRKEGKGFKVNAEGRKGSSPSIRACLRGEGVTAIARVDEQGRTSDLEPPAKRQGRKSGTL